ncbi:2192_t:CDS:2, partial [Dentiscutata erythropus]
ICEISNARRRIFYKGYRVLIEEFEEGLPVKLVLKQGGGVYDNVIANTGKSRRIS